MPYHLLWLSVAAFLMLLVIPPVWIYSPERVQKLLSVLTIGAWIMGIVSVAIYLSSHYVPYHFLAFPAAAFLTLIAIPPLSRGPLLLVWIMGIPLVLCADDIYRGYD